MAFVNHKHVYSSRSECHLCCSGVKEKTIAARRAGVTNLIFPDANRRDFDDLPDNVKEGLTVHFCKTYDEVKAIAFAESSS